PSFGELKRSTMMLQMRSYRLYLLVMNLVTQDSGPQKGTDHQTGILKGHPERFCVNKSRV
ncbi:hypothetical protein ACMS4N_005045, partial [Escherichia coli]